MRNFLGHILISTLLFSGVLFSQNNKSDSLSTFEFKWSNDFEYQTDYYFTNGFTLKFFSSSVKANPVNSILFTHSSNDVVLYGVSLVQDIYTPKERFYVPDQLNGDRPFAAYILLGSNKLSFNKAKRMVFYSELQIGVLGPLALGEETQNGIHSMLPTSSEVNGWENQISNSLMLDYTLAIEKIFSIKKWFEASGILSAQLGLPFTNVGAGFKTRLGIFSLFPKGFEFLSAREWELFLTLSAKGSLVGYNATIQGGLFSESIYTLDNINRFVGFASIGFTAIYKGLKLEYAQHFNTPEFSGAVYHSWGYLIIKVRL